VSENLFVLLGATGTLAKEKIFPYLKNIDSEVVLYARRPVETKLDFVLGDLDNFEPLVKYINFKGSKNLYFYVALPPDLFIPAVNSVKKYFGDKNFHIALEKPFGTSPENAVELAKTIWGIGPEKFYLVDHYLAKEALTNFLNLHEAERKEITDPEKIKNIEVSILEEETVNDRGAFYDKVGAIKDTGQNHLLNILSTFLNPDDRIDILENLKYIPDSLITKQYGGYKNIDGVDPNSKTETYFKAAFDYKGLGVIFETGKALQETKTDIKVTYKDGHKFELKIKPNPNESKTAHEYVIADFLSGENKFSLTLPEALESWKVIEQLLPPQLFSQD
jgi:glucose-6-phosphate 1-dehydrogenase